MPTLADLSDTPRFPIRVVSARTGVAAGTLRAWERRHRLLVPGRSSGNYRLYSERDIGIVRWVKDRLGGGATIRVAAADVGAMRRSGRWPPAPPPLGGASSPAAPRTEGHLRRLYAVLVGRNEARAGEVLRAAHAEMGPEALCLRVIQPCLVAIGMAWHRGEIRIATEHFASQFLRGHLMALFQAEPVRRRGPRIVVGCAPRERHDIGALMLALFLRRAGYRVEFLGADVDLADLVEYARSSRPDIVCLSANSEATALSLGTVESRLTALSPAPRFGFGGAAFGQRPGLRERVPGRYLGGDPVEAVKRVRDLLSEEPTG
jgi:methanogenic corrinoid protein MtbC1